MNRAGVRPMTSPFGHPRPVAARPLNAANKNDTDGAVEPPTRRTRRPMSEETKQKISEGRKGAKHSEETKMKISQAMKNRPPKAIVHRLRISKARQGVIQSEETRRKISIAVATTKRSLKKQRLAARAAEAAEAATADLRPAFSNIYVGSTSTTYSTGSGDDYSTHGGPYSGSESESDYEEEPYGHQGQPVLLNALELEKAIIEVTALRRQLTAWMDAYENKFGRKPDLTEASETHPLVYGRFVRYVALRELVRTSSLLIGSTPVTWN